MPAVDHTDASPSGTPHEKEKVKGKEKWDKNAFIILLKAVCGLIFTFLLFPSLVFLVLLAIIENMSTITAQVELYRLINEANRRGERVVVATVAHTRGSTPQRRGAKMLFFENGEVAGTVGGGCIEAEVWAEAREAMRTGISALHEFKLTADEASEEGMVCGGTMEIFIVW